MSLHKLSDSLPNTSDSPIVTKLISTGPAILLLASCFAYSAFQILNGRIEIDAGDAAKYASISLFMADDPSLVISEQFEHVSALGNSAVFAMTRIIAGWFHIKADANTMFQLANLCASFGLILIGWLFVRREAGEYAALLAAGFIIGNQFFVNYSLNTYAEPMGTFFVLLAACLVIKSKAEARGVITAALLLLVASLFRHEYFLFGWYLAAWLCLKKKFRLALLSAAISPLFYVSKQFYQTLAGSPSADYQAWLDYPVQGTAMERLHGGLELLLESFTIDFLHMGWAIGLLLLIGSGLLAWKDRKKPPLLMTFILCHSLVLLVLWTTAISPHIQQRHAAVVEYLFPFALGCSLVHFDLPRRITYEHMRSLPHLALLATTVVLTGLALWFHRAEIYGIRYNRISSDAVEARKYLAGNINNGEKVYLGYGPWSTYLQHHCFLSGTLGNSYGYSNEGFYGIVPSTFNKSEERREEIDELISTRHRDFFSVAPDFVVLSNPNILTQFTRKRGAGTIHPFLIQTGNNPDLLEWESPYTPQISNLVFQKVFPHHGDEGEIIIYQAKPRNSS